MTHLLKRVGVSAIVLGLTAIEAIPTPLLAAGKSAAQAITSGLEATKAEAGLDSTPLPTLIGRLIQALLGVVGIIFLVYTVYAGIMYMTAGGDPGKVEKAKKMLNTSVVGLILIVIAYSLTAFVIKTITDATAGTGGG